MALLTDSAADRTLLPLASPSPLIVYKKTTD